MGKKSLKHFLLVIIFSCHSRVGAVKLLLGKPELPKMSCIFHLFVSSRMNNRKRPVETLQSLLKRKLSGLGDKKRKRKPILDFEERVDVLTGSGDADYLLNVNIS